MNLPTVYQLDRNVVIEVEHALGSKGTPFLERLRAIDIPGNVVSPLLSVTEGHVKEKRDVESFQASLDRETAALDRFFQHARTDTTSLREVANLGAAFVAEVRATQDVDIGFIKQVQKNFHQLTAQDQARAEYAKAKELIASSERPLSDKLSLACIATALGSKAARGVMKPRKEPDDSHAFNALADLEKLSLLNYMRALSVREGKTDRVELFSFDEDLVSYCALVKPTWASVKHLKSFEEVTYSIPLQALLDSMLHLTNKAKLRSTVEADLEAAGL